MLGPEYDRALWDRVLSALRRLGATPAGRNWGVGGSQEIASLAFSFRGHELLLEAETYVGISLTGPPEDVETIRLEIR